MARSMCWFVCGNQEADLRIDSTGVLGSWLLRVTCRTIAKYSGNAIAVIIDTGMTIKSITIFSCLQIDLAIRGSKLFSLV